jgi:hypothetical protein
MFIVHHIAEIRPERSVCILIFQDAKEQSALIAEFVKQKTLKVDETKGERRQHSWQLENASAENLSPAESEREKEKGMKTSCATCHVDVSPIWWPVSAQITRGSYICQMCHVKRVDS